MTEKLTWSHVHANDGLRWNHVNGTVCTLGEVPTTVTLGDPVSRPSHYNQLPVECIDVAEHFGYLLGNVIKYVWRHQHKGKPLEDLRKARFYLDHAIQKLEEEK